MGVDIYRMKGVLAIAHSEKKFVYQAVHMIFNGNFEDSWAEGEKRESKLVFIGKDLPKDELRAGFAACAATAEAKQKRLKALRFGVGDKVECNTGEGWRGGTVVQLMYRETFMPPGMVAPYQVQIDGGALIYAPADENAVIRRAGGQAPPKAPQ